VVDWARSTPLGIASSIPSESDAENWSSTDVFKQWLLGAGVESVIELKTNRSVKGASRLLEGFRS